MNATLRAMKAAVAWELRQEARDLHAQARTLEDKAATIERTWRLRHQSYDCPTTASTPIQSEEIHAETISAAELERKSRDAR